jgi:hypothetical protein
MQALEMVFGYLQGNHWCNSIYVLEIVLNKTILKLYILFPEM